MNIFMEGFTAEIEKQASSMGTAELVLGTATMPITPLISAASQAIRRRGLDATDREKLKKPWDHAKDISEKAMRPALGKALPTMVGGTAAGFGAMALGAHKKMPIKATKALYAAGLAASLVGPLVGIYKGMSTYGRKASAIIKEQDDIATRALGKDKYKE